MAKTIKFNLICDGKPIRTIEDLQNNFSVEDILTYYDNQLLHRWLRVRGYEKELNAVSAITSTAPIDIIKELIGVFEISTDAQKVEEDIYILKYQNEKKECNSIYAQQDYMTNLVIEDYEAGYRQLVDGILSNPTDPAKIKANISAIIADYSWAFEMDHRRLFWILNDNKYFLAILCLLMNDVARKYYLPVESTELSGPVKLNTQEKTDKFSMYSRIKVIAGNQDCRESYIDYVKIKPGDTKNYWDDLECDGRKYMILSMDSGCNVKSYSEKTGTGLSYEEVKDKFVILDGIKYRSDKSYAKLLYMEV